MFDLCLPTCHQTNILNCSGESREALLLLDTLCPQIVMHFHHTCHDSISLLPLPLGLRIRSHCQLSSTDWPSEQNSVILNSLVAIRERRSHSLQIQQRNLPPFTRRRRPPNDTVTEISKYDRLVDYTFKSHRTLGSWMCCTTKLKQKKIQANWICRKTCRARHLHP